MSRSPHRTERHSNTSPQNLGVTTEPARASPSNGQPDASSSRPPTAGAQNSNFSRMMAGLTSVVPVMENSNPGMRIDVSHSPSARRSTGLHNILNPPSDPTYQPSQASAASPRQRTCASGYGVPAPPFASPRIRKRIDSRSPTRDHEVGQMAGHFGRRVLTPKSPGLRATSLGSHMSPSMGAGLLTRGPSRYNESHVYTAEPGERRDSTIPPLPPLPVSRTNVPATNATGGSGNRIPPPPQGPGVGYAAGPTSASQASISNTPHVPFAPQTSTSPSYQHSPGLRAHSETPVPKSEFSAGFPPAQGSSSRQGEHYTQSGWMLALEGGDVGVLVDNQQASKVADEKRKRNAGASARFRARRKEREKEASQTISGLQQELRDTAEDKDFYINERNFYRDLFVRHNPGPLPPRPSSPPIRRVHGLVSTGHESDLSSDYGRRESTELPDQKRRMGDYHPSFTASTPGTTSYQAMYTPYPYNHQSPGAFGEARPGPSAATQLPPPRTQVRDPFQRDVLDRNWNSGK